jgi:glucose-1-phosphate adenylyltransferase
MADILSQTATFVLAGGRGARLAPLTHERSQPAVPFGDRQTIDFTLLNCLHSNIIHPYVITQYQAANLTRHVRRWWLRQSAAAEAATAPVCVPAPHREYLGTADALLRNIHALEPSTRYVMVLSADHVYDMDYRDLLQFHTARNADATLAAVVYPSDLSRQFGILEVDSSGRIAGFEEKPAQPKPVPGQPGKVLANMGIYVFDVGRTKRSLILASRFI